MKPSATDEPGVYRLADGARVRLGALQAKAGEGTIYAVEGQPELVAKIFHPTLKGLDVKLEKVAVMVESVPPGATQKDGFTVLTWPTDIVCRDDRPVGYVMPRIDTANAVEIHALSNPSNRANPLPGSAQWPAHATWRHLLTVAANLCVAVDAVHQVDAVIGDFQERNILVADTCRVTLVDCDSMQFTDPTGRVFVCAVARSEFIAPELVGHDLASHVRAKEADLFSLAVHIYLLLMAGNHPFLRGIWRGRGEQPGAMELARTGDWVGGAGSDLHTHPLAPPVTFLPNPIQQLFARAFTMGAREPAVRPSADEWHTALSNVTVSTCSRGAHQIPVGATACPWCAIDDERARRRETSSIRDQAVDQVVSQSSAKPAVRGSAAAKKAASQTPDSHIAAASAGAFAGARWTRRWTWRSAAVPAILASLIVIAGIVAAVSTHNLSGSQQATPQWQPFIDAAKRTAVDLTTFDYRTVASDTRDVLKSSTGTLHADFSSRSESWAKTVRDARTVGSGTVTGAGLQSLDDRRAKVLVAITVHTTNGDDPPEDPREWRMVLDVEMIGTDCKTSNVEFVP